ncbi:protein phosphatase CheZ [Sneathiella glossodoripedis]|uniref:protein phosphatase CheZ n=1 Tax=Sneathiella glossodoripedis TaxID=418853 RepID=UPI00046EB255|nr:protein phosphatase CheZ [Sneathiella glossodoripedis]
MSKKMFSAEIKQLKNGISGNSDGENQGGGISQEQYEELLEAINSVKADIAENASKVEETPQSMSEKMLEDFKKEFADSLELKSELEELSRVIMDTRREITSINSNDKGAKIHAMTDQLDAVVADTETATNEILAAVETIEDKNESLELNATDPDELEITETISKAVMKIYEACNFQDITGQRISKVVGTLKFVEDRIQAMIEILGGEDQLSALEGIEQEIQKDGDIELSGPRAEGQEISQDEIDALFD